ncbi:MAG TPA: NifB/NifX family molybdenum-iron cluster-binding protein [Petrotogaceae bacterium]|nr:NifB/NifX family molybdenum-iron cluster-binding protein [Petrotogaceae bacterium]HQO11744.1 NifB/NifX family molybdenum-iron cluster-binding protein [Petrotogaceae bacterium]HQP57426.1 NifB/NifX family molybdenum-iron cluster-binding protein [Petrotogaceae bacterium]
MKIGLCAKHETKSSQVDDRFARASFFVVYNSSTSEYTFFKNPFDVEHGAGPKVIEFFAEKGVTVLIAPTLGPNAQKAAQMAEMSINEQTQSTVEENIKDFLEKHTF